LLSKGRGGSSGNAAAASTSTIRRISQDANEEFDSSHFDVPLPTRQPINSSQQNGILA